MPPRVEIEEYYPITPEEMAELMEYFRQFVSTLGKYTHTLVAELILSKNIR